MIRYAIWTAVSTEAQTSKDALSLEIQSNKCREAARARGWQEIAIYEVPGESRQRYVNLRDAEIEIPALKKMLDDAQAGRFDILVMYDYNRLRDLLDMVSKSLSHYGVQIYSVSQPVEPVHPSKYSPYNSDVSIIMETIAKMTSRVQNNDLRRKYMEAMPRRASQRGLPVQVPFGYKKARDSKTPPELDPELEPYLVTMKDMLLSGKSAGQIAEYMNTTGVRPRGLTWYRQTVYDILTNPFYAGIVRWGMTHAELDPRTGRVKRNRKVDPAKVVSGKGLHVAVWDEATHRAILHELSGRRHTYTGKSVHVLTGLLECGLCGERLWAFYNTVKKPENLVWRCSSRAEHVSIRNAEALRLLSVRIAEDINNLDPHEDPAPEQIEQLKADLLEAQGQRDRIGDAYDAGVYSLDEFSRRASGWDDAIAGLQSHLTALETDQHNNAVRRLAIEQLQAMPGRFSAWLDQTPSQDANYVLRRLLQGIVVEESQTLTLKWL